MIFTEKSCGFATRIDISNGTYATIPLNGDGGWTVLHVGDKTAWMGHVLTWEDLGRWASDMKPVYKYNVHYYDKHIYSGDNFEFMKKVVSDYKKQLENEGIVIKNYAFNNYGYRKISDDFWKEL